MPRARILSVGQCAYDHGNIARTLGQKVDAEVTGVDTCDDAIETLRGGGYSLVLVNRIIDGDGASGLELIRALKADAALATVPVMLVSNYPQAQADAEALGALPGFGKAELSGTAAIHRIAAALEPTG
jgi:two-component system chemotaxis response regulator CheY